MDQDSRTLNREKVQSVFNHVVPYYDIMNDCLSLGLHRLWKKYLIRSLLGFDCRRIVDLSTGTGDLLVKLIEQFPSSEFFAVDPDSQMLRYAQLKVAKTFKTNSNVRYIEKCAEFLSEEFIVPADLIVCSFGLRNMTQRTEALRQIKQSLLTNGQLRILEFSPTTLRYQSFYDVYRNHYIPFVGKFLFNDAESYQYLSDSIRDFLLPEEVLTLLREVGFKNVSAYPLSEGIVYLYEATA